MKLGKAVAAGYAEERAEAHPEQSEETVVREEAPVAAVVEEPEPVAGR